MISSLRIDFHESHHKKPFMTSVPGRGMIVVEDGLVIQRAEPSHEGFYDFHL